MTRLDPKLQELLETCTVPYELKTGARHIKIIIGNRLAGILPRCGGRNSVSRAQLNVLTQVRRAIKKEMENVAS